MQLREDEFERESGSRGVYTVVDKPDFVVIIAIEGDDIYLVEQYRYTVGLRALEMPQGAWEGQYDVEPEKLAAGELKEETGLTAKSMTYVGFQYLAYGFCSQGYHVFLASGFTQGEQELDQEEEGLLCKKVKVSDFEKMIINGEIKDASSVNAYGLAKLKGLI
jgi:8-oxo-dGTP pyrophosphatase MutT (NUDIX family)